MLPHAARRQKCSLQIILTVEVCILEILCSRILLGFHDACGCQILCTSSAQLWSLGKERLGGNYTVHSFPNVYEGNYIRGHFASQCHTAVLECTQYTQLYTAVLAREHTVFFLGREFEKKLGGTESE